MYMYLDMNDAISAMKLCNLHWGLSGHRIACSTWMTSDPVYTDRQRVKGEGEVGEEETEVQYILINYYVESWTIRL